MASNIFHPSMFEETYFNGEIHTDNTEDIPLAQEDIDAYDRKLDSEIVKANNDVPNQNYSLSDNNNINKYNDRYVLGGIQETTLLSLLFFCKKNIDSLQNILRYSVYKALGVVIDQQDYKELLIFMRGIYLEQAIQPPIISDNDTSKRKSEILPLYIREISRLNKLVVHRILPNLVSQVQQYLHYIRDITEEQYQNWTPINTSKTGTTEYRSSTQVYLGGDF